MPPAFAHRAVVSVGVGAGISQIFPTTLNNFSFLDSQVVFLPKKGPGYLCCFGRLARYFFLGFLMIFQCESHLQDHNFPHL